MNKVAIAIALSFVTAFALPQKVSVVDSTVHARNYSFSFANGNLLPNWSFEDGYYAWEGTRYSKHVFESLIGRKFFAVTGSYMGAAFGSHALTSPLVPVEGGEDYSLGLYVASFGAGTEKPKVRFFSSKYVVLSDAVLPDFPASYEKWVFYSAHVKAPATARFAKVIFENTGTGILLFDDVILEKGTNPSDRNSVGMSVVFSDAFGRTHMKETLVRREVPNGLVPLDEVRGDVVYGKARVELKARSRAYGGNIESGDYMLLDNDVKVRDPSVANLRVAAKNKIQLGDRDSLHADVFYGNKLNWNHQDYVRHHEKSTVVDAYNLDFGSIDVGTSNVTVNNDKQSTLVPGKYKDVMIRARGKLHISSGAYYFRKFTLEPTAVLDLDLSGGDIEIYVKSDLKIYDNTRFTYDSTLTNYIVWRLGQSSTMRFGTDSKLAGVFVAPNARVELGHRSYLRGAIYAREVAILEESKIKVPSFIFDAGRNFNAPGAKLFAVTENGYDNHGRNKYSDKPYIAELDSEGYVQNSQQNANNYYSATGDGPDAGNFAFYRKDFSSKDGHLLKSSIPGLPWRVNGPHSGMSYHQAFVPDLSIPASMNFSYHVEDSMYVLSASENREGHMSLSWKNRLGQVVQEAWALDTVGEDMRNWSWAIKRYEYTREGRLRSVLTPLDTKNADSLFAVVSEYDAAGHEIARTAPDIGRETFYYGIAGNVRFSQTAEQRVRNAFTYKEYDEQGRIVSIGESVWSLWSDDLLGELAALDSAVPGTKTEYSGRSYDRLSKCLAAIGDSALSATISGVTLTNTRGRLACTWTRNPKLYGYIPSGEALVADFFSYDSVGRVSVAYRYTGAERDSTCRLVSKRVTFDDLGRLTSVTIRNAGGTTISERNFEYDVKGRVSSVRDVSGNLLAAYTYDDFGRKKVVDVGSALRAEYGYHLHGQVNSIRILNPATSSVLFEQRINFENVDDSIAQPRFDGRISQVKSTTNLQDSTLSENSVYIYDMMGNLSKSAGTAGEVDFAYDENGRMLSQDYGSSRLDYVYGPGSYAVSSATGHTPMDAGRDASRANNFAYDASGRMMHDSSRGLSIAYDMDGMPAVFLQDSGSGTWRELAVYDPSGWRVATYSYENGSLVSLRTDIMLDGHKELERRTSFAGSGSSVTEYSMLYGAGGALGRRHSDGTSEWYVKDRQGSLVMSVVNSGLNTALVYEPFGFQRLLRVSGDEPAEQYTGKEYDGRLGLYYFGARYFDPSFALWLTPDPARQYLNPYSYGGDPVNRVDYDGKWSWGEALLWGVAEVLTAGGVSAGAVALTLGGGGLQAAAINVGREAYSKGGNFSEWDWGKIWNADVSANLAMIPGYAEAMTNISFINRLWDSDNKWETFTDYLLGGYGVDYAGHMAGGFNSAFFGGNMDYYRGNVVYSEGFLRILEKMGKSGGGDHFGSAALVTDRYDEPTIAHEFNHLRQAESMGCRFFYLGYYLYKNGGSPFPNDEYYKNDLEMDSYYKGFLYEAGCIDIYGNRRTCQGKGKDEWTHEELSDVFYNGGPYTGRDGETYLWAGYKKEHPEVDYGEHWTWRENWWSLY